MWKGEVILLNVDFENTEASRHSMDMGDLTGNDHRWDWQNDKNFLLPGIITANKNSNEG